MMTARQAIDALVPPWDISYEALNILRDEESEEAITAIIELLNIFAKQHPHLHKEMTKRINIMQQKGNA